MELDILERNILKAIDNSSAFHISVIMKVYEECKSFDKTITVLRVSTQRNISPQTAIDWLGYHST
jgi:hypothetical protein